MAYTSVQFAVGDSTVTPAIAERSKGFPSPSAAAEVSSLAVHFSFFLHVFHFFNFSFLHFFIFPIFSCLHFVIFSLHFSIFFLVTIGTKTAASTRAMSDSAARKTGVKKDVEKAAAAASQEVRIAKIVKSAAKQSTAVKAERLQVPKCRRSNMTQSKGRHKCKNSSDTKDRREGRAVPVRWRRRKLSQRRQRRPRRRRRNLCRVWPRPYRSMLSYGILL